MINKESNKSARKSFTMVAIIDNEVVGQQWDLSEWEIPYGVINFQRDFPGATLSIENQSGRVVDVISPSV